MTTGQNIAPKELNKALYGLGLSPDFNPIENLWMVLKWAKI